MVSTQIVFGKVLYILHKDTEDPGTSIEKKLRTKKTNTNKTAKIKGSEKKKKKKKDDQNVSTVGYMQTREVANVAAADLVDENTDVDDDEIATKSSNKKTCKRKKREMKRTKLKVQKRKESKGKMIKMP